MKIDNLPKTREGKVFGDMVMKAFDPLKNYIEFNHLEEELTEEDLHLFAHALAQGLGHWVEWLKLAKRKKFMDRD